MRAWPRFIRHHRKQQTVKASMPRLPGQTGPVRRPSPVQSRCRLRGHPRPFIANRTVVTAAATMIRVPTEVINQV